MRYPQFSQKSNDSQISRIALFFELFFVTLQVRKIGRLLYPFGALVNKHSELSIEGCRVAQASLWKQAKTSDTMEGSEIRQQRMGSGSAA